MVSKKFLTTSVLSLISFQSMSGVIFNKYYQNEEGIWVKYSAEQVKQINKKRKAYEANQLKRIKEIENKRNNDPHLPVFSYLNKKNQFLISGAINGKQEIFLIDSGASKSAISEKLANQLRLPRKHKIRISTAGGGGSVYLTEAEIKLNNNIHKKVEILIIPNLHTPIIGINFLKNFNLHQKKDELRISP